MARRKGTTERRSAAVGVGEGPSHAQVFQALAARLSERFFARRPELNRGDGHYGVALVCEWIWLTCGAFRAAPADRVGEIFWDRLLHADYPRDFDPAVIVDAAVSFLVFLGSEGVLPADASRHLHQQARLEGLAFIAMTLGLLSESEVTLRARRYAPDMALMRKSLAV